MKYDVVRTSRFVKDLKRIIKRGYELNELDKIVELLSNGSVIPEKYKDHPLKNSEEFKDCRELHIKPDWLLVYRYYSNEVILYLMRTGTHSDLF